MHDRSAVDDLKRRVPIMVVVRHMGLATPPGAPWVFQCPVCDEAAARVRPDGQGYACRAEGCGHSGDALTLIAAVRRRPLNTPGGFADALMTLAEIAATEERRRAGKLQDDLFTEVKG